MHCNTAHKNLRRRLGLITYLIHAYIGSVIAQKYSLVKFCFFILFFAITFCGEIKLCIYKYKCAAFAWVDVGNWFIEFKVLQDTQTYRPRNLPFVTPQGSKETFLSLHYHTDHGACVISNNGSHLCDIGYAMRPKMVKVLCDSHRVLAYTRVIVCACASSCVVGRSNQWVSEWGLWLTRRHRCCRDRLGTATWRGVRCGWRNDAE